MTKITDEKAEDANLPTVKIVKRDDRLVTFDDQEIYDALVEAKQKIHGRVTPLTHQKVQSVVTDVNREIAERLTNNVKIYEIQGIMGHTLLSNDEYTLAEEYIHYRTQRDLERSKVTSINISISKLINKDQTVVNKNTNKDSSVFNTQRDLTAGIIGKSIGLKMLPSRVANVHQKDNIHYHDLDYHLYTPMTSCCLIGFKDMLNNGFKIRNANVESPKSIQAATAQTSQIITNVASSQYGGCSADRIDELLASFAERSCEEHLADAQEWIEGEEHQKAFARGETKKDVFDAIQSLEYEISTLFASNGQTPFTSLGFGLGTNWFEQEIQRAVLQIRINGSGIEKRTAIFPKLIFTVKRGVSAQPTDPDYGTKQLALECTTERVCPDVLSYDKIAELTGGFKVPMGCRSFLQGWKDEQGEEVNAGRMNLGVVALNLPRIALEAQENQEEFWQILNERLTIVRDTLVYRVERVKEAKPANAPISYMYGAFEKRLATQDAVDELFKDKRATVSPGYISLYEVASTLYGGAWEDDQEAKSFALNILKELERNTDNWGNEYDYHFDVCSTPSEGLTDRFCRLDTEKLGIIEDTTDKEYYTNSFHYDVRRNPTSFEKLDFEKDYPKYCSDDFIHYYEYPMLQQNPKAPEVVWGYAYDKVGYLGTNTPIDHCYACGFEGDFHPTERGFEYPECGNHDPKTCDVVERTCDCLGDPQTRPVVHGRHKEVSSRVKYLKD